MKKEYDLEKMKERSSKHDPQAAETQIGLRLDGSLIALIKEESQRLGIPYQTLIQSVLHQYVHGELISSKQLKQFKLAVSS